MTNKEVVVAHYKEDLSWMDQLGQFPRTIYHKGYDFVDADFDNEPAGVNCYLPNIGNEAHTYLWHIVSRYDSLADITIFVQGNPFDHTKETISRINYSVGAFAKHNGFWNLCDFVTTTDDWGRPHHTDNLIPVGKYYSAIFGEDWPGELTFGYGAQFAVTKESIQKRPKQFYEKLLKMTTRNELVAPLVMERLWHKIFA